MPPGQFAVLAIAGHVSISGFLYGLDTGSIGPITSMPQFADSIGKLNSTQQGIYVACILLSAAISSLAGGHVADAISRRYGILIGGLLSLTGNVLSAASPNFATLIGARIITGAGLGQAVAVTTVYLVELAPKEIRGVAACLLQTYVVVGITVGYFIAFGTASLHGSMAWRVPFIVQAVFAALLSAGMLFMPFSPRWLMQKGRIEDARFVLSRFQRPDGVESELREIETSLLAGRELNSGRFLEMFERRYVGRTSLGIFLMAFQQLTGIDAVLYYAPVLFRQAGLSSDRATFLASGVSGIVMLVCTIPAQIWIDRWGRRKPLIYGGSAMATCFVVIGALYAQYGVKKDGGVLLQSSVARWVVIVLNYLFVANFSWSWAVVGKIYACEIIPTRLRAKVSAVELLANWLVNFAVALTAPLFLRQSPSGPYFLYGGSTIIAVIVCVGMPETKGKALEEIEEYFEKGLVARRSDGESENQAS